MWDDSPNKNDNIMFRRMKAIGTGQVKIGDKRLWTNSELILDRLVEEKHRRKWRSENSFTPVETASWGNIIRETTEEQIKRRELDIPNSCKRNESRNNTHTI